jgi:hypothetical protein
VSRDPSAYRFGDLVTWMRPGNLPISASLRAIAQQVAHPWSFATSVEGQS